MPERPAASVRPAGAGQGADGDARGDRSLYACARRGQSRAERTSQRARKELCDGPRAYDGAAAASGSDGEDAPRGAPELAGVPDDGTACRIVAGYAGRPAHADEDSLARQCRASGLDKRCERRCRGLHDGYGHHGRLRVGEREPRQDSDARAERAGHHDGLAAGDECPEQRFRLPARDGRQDEEPADGGQYSAGRVAGHLDGCGLGAHGDADAGAVGRHHGSDRPVGSLFRLAGGCCRQSQRARGDREGGPCADDQDALRDRLDPEKPQGVQRHEGAGKGEGRRTQS